MDTTEMIDAVEDWVTVTLPGVNRYDYPPEEISLALPLVIAAVRADQTQDGKQEESFPQAAYEQTNLRLWSVETTIMVAANPPRDATRTVYGYVDAIGRSLRSGVRLGGNVVLSQYYEASYDPPEVEYNDGTIARQVTISVVVGETVGA